VEDLYHENGWLETPEVTIEEINGSIKLIWNNILGANSYSVYSSNEPYTTEENWALQDSGITVTTWSEIAVLEKKFYYVKVVH